MTKPTGGPRGRPRKYLRPVETTTTAATLVPEENLDEEIAALDKEIARLESEAAPPTSGELSWDEIDAGGLEALEQRERRRSIIPKLLTAAKIKRAELRVQRERRAAEPLEAIRAQAYKEMEDAEARHYKALEEREQARGRWSHAHGRIEKIERRIRDSEREIAELKGER
jgi:hypothetical protein